MIWLINTPARRREERAWAGDFSKAKKTRTMTTRQRFEKMLYHMGVFENQAAGIMDLAIPMVAESIPHYRVTWDAPADEYPDGFYASVFESVVKKAAIDWIDANLPAAWFRPLFI